MRKTRMKMLMFGTDDDYVDTDNDIDRFPNFCSL